MCDARFIDMYMSARLLGFVGRAAEQKDVRLGAMNHVVDPSARLLDPNVAPLGLGHEAAVGNLGGDVLGENHMSGEERKWRSER